VGLESEESLKILLLNKSLKYVDFKNERLKYLFFINTKLRMRCNEIFDKLKGCHFIKIRGYCFKARFVRSYSKPLPQKQYKT
jgi:hypothetical protein